MKELLKSTPQLLQFETDTRCNGKCTFCEHQNMKRSGKAKWSDLIELMYWVVPQVKEVCPFGMQEPLLESRLTALLANIKQFNMKAQTYLYTNMTIYNEETFTRLIKQQNLDKLSISFYGTNKRVYNKLQPGLDYYQVQKNIKKFMKLRKRLGWRKPEVHMQLMVTPETEKDANKFVTQWSKTVDLVGFTKKDGWCGKQEYNPEYEDQIWGEPAKIRLPCQRLWTIMTVHYDGTMVPCCLDAHNEHPLTNAFDDPAGAFNSQAMQDLRQLHIEGKQDTIDLCRDCTFWRHDTPQEWIEFWLKQENATSAVTPCT